MKIFISSTYEDLIKHREAITDVITRMKHQYSAMEYFGSRTDEAIPACKSEIDESDILIGVYAWRYGWQPRKDSVSITEEEFKHAKNKKRLCYIVDESYPWPPKFIDQGDAATRLIQFKSSVSKLVRSKFTSPDNLAKQVAADLAREITPSLSKDSFGGLLRVNWEVFSSELQNVLSTAFSQAKIEAADGIVATRHVITALANTPNTANSIMAVYRNVPIQPLIKDRPKANIYEMFAYDKPVSSCVLASMSRLLPNHSVSQRLLAIELAVDLIKNGRGSSVADFRRAGIDSKAVDKTMNQIRQISSETQNLKKALDTLDDAEIIHIAYIANVEIPANVSDFHLRNSLLKNAVTQKRILILVGELIRRHPRLIDI